MAFDIAFWIMAVIIVGAALAVVLVRDVFRAALFLVLCLFTVAGIFVMLGADFIAAAQVLIYIGAISILILLAIMLTRDTQQANRASRVRIPAVVVSVLLGGLMICILLNSSWQIAELPSAVPTTASLGALLFGESGFILPIEIAAVLMLAAVLGAIVLIKEK